MTIQDESSEPQECKLSPRFAAASRRFISMVESIHDSTGPWLRSGRAKDIIESSETNAGAIGEICSKLLVSLRIAHSFLGLKEDPPYENGWSWLKVGQYAPASDDSKADEPSQELLSLVCNGARVTADLVRPLLNRPTKWMTGEELDYLGRCLDYTTWQIFKEFAKLVRLFDDHDNPNSKEPCEAWRRDQLAMDED